MESKEELIAFNKAYSKLIEVIASDDTPKELQEVTAWLKEVFDYNVVFGKLGRGLAVVKTCQLMAEHEKRVMTEEQLELARILGWTVEILQAYFLILDDIMDQSETRRGQVCWYKKENVGLNSINDSQMLEQGLYLILKKYFTGKKCYRDFLELFHDITLKTTYGQCLDMSASRNNTKPQFEMFTPKRYLCIIKYKTAYYSYVLPIRLGIYFSSCHDKEEHALAENILVKIGQLFQIQDDYLDCFGDPKLMRKVGTDIEEGKCCWPIVTAFQYCSPEQLETLKANYGIRDAKCVQIVRDVYNDLNLTAVYRKEEDMLYKEICGEINALRLKCNLNPQIFKHALDKTYKRKK